MSMQGRHKTGQALMHAILALVAIYTLAPLVFLIFNSFKSNNEIVDSPVSAPSSWSFQYIISAAQQIHFFRAIWIDEIVIEGLEIRPLGLDSVEFDEAGTMEIGFIAIKPGSYSLHVPGSTGESQMLRITIE